MNITVYKSLRLLVCRVGNEVILECPVQLGFGANDGPKLQEGDGRTPEGRYVISSKNPASKFHLALGLSYPNPNDAHRGFETGIISRETMDDIISRDGRPPWNTPMGGFIMIHGQPNSGSRDGDWTAGCIAVSDEVMDMIFPLACIGDKVVINP